MPVSLQLAFLAFLRQGAKHGYELKAEFEALFGGLWEVNAGQIYTTLGRMQRDGLVTHERVLQDDRPDKKMYRLTEAGEQTIVQWMDDAVEFTESPRDELLVKIFVLHRLDQAACLRAVRAQRIAYFAALREFTKRKLSTTDQLQRLIVDRAILRVQADLEWLDMSEQVLSQEMKG